MNAKYLAIITAAGLITLGVGNSLSASGFRGSSTAESGLTQVIAQAETTRFPAVYTENGVALDGQDVVAYFTQSELYINA